MKKTVSEIAAKGRYGDDALLHVSTTELQGLAALSPTGQLTINPDTGLPEAFFFLPFLMGAAAPAAAGAAAAAAPALAAAAAPAAAGLGALGTGLGAGMTAASGALGATAGLGSLAATAPTAMTAAAPALASAAPTALSAAAPALASAAPTAMTAAAPTLASAAPTAASALPAASTVPGALAPSQAAIGSTIEAAHAAGAIPATGPVGVLPPSVNAIPGGVATPTLAPNPASVMGQGIMGPTNPISATSIPQAGDLAAGIGPEPFAGPAIEPSGAGGIVADVPMTGNYYGTGPMSGAFPEAPGAVAAEQGGLGSLMGGLGNIDLMKLAPLAMMMPKGGGGSKKKGEKKDTKGIKYEGGDPVFPDDDYRGGIDPEWRYFPAFAEGGQVPRPDGLPFIPPGYQPDGLPFIPPELPRPDGLPVMPPGYQEPDNRMQRTIDTRGVDGFGSNIIPTTDSPYHAIESFTMPKTPSPSNDPIIGDWGPDGGIAPELPPTPTTPKPTPKPTPSDDRIIGDWGPDGGIAPGDLDPIIGDWGPDGGIAPDPTTPNPNPRPNPSIPTPQPTPGPQPDPNNPRPNPSIPTPQPTPIWRDAYERHPSLTPQNSTNWGWNNNQTDTSQNQQQGSGGFDTGNWAGGSTPQHGMASGNTNNGQWGWGQKTYAEGGLASVGPDLMEGGGIGSLMGASPAMPQIDPAQDEMLIEAAVQAIQGQVENPEAILQAFVQTFGEQALQELIASVQGGVGGLTAGPGDGMSDSIPANIDGVQPAAISSGEFIVPADVVSGLGNGSTDAGAAQLEDMMGRVRQMRNGGAVQPPAIDPKKVMPV